MNTLEKEKTVVLNFPIQLAEKTLTEITMRRPLVEDELSFTPSSKDPRQMAREEATYFARLCGLNLEEIKKMDMQDYEEVQQCYLSFRGRTSDTKGFDETRSLPE